MRMEMRTVRLLALSTIMCIVLLTGSVLSPLAATAATYYVATNGLESNPGTQLKPFQTIKKGISVLKAGDTLYIRGGSYTEWISWQNQTIPSGTSWSNPITIAGYPNETMTLKGMIDISSRSHEEKKYLILRDFVVDAAGMGNNGAYIGTPFVRLQNLEIKNYTNNGVQVSAHHNEFINLRVHDSTQPRYHGFYVWGADNLFDGIDVYNNSGYGMQFYNSKDNAVHRNVIRNCRIHHNGSSTNNGGIIISHGDRNEVYNNVVYNNTHNGGGISIAYNATNSLVYNNTVYGNSNPGISIGTGTSGAIIKNNIVYSNKQPDIDDKGSGTTLSHNYTSDPQFINAAVGDFHLRSGSPAKIASDSGGEVGAYGGPGSPPIVQLPAPRNMRLLVAP